MGLRELQCLQSDKGYGTPLPRSYRKHLSMRWATQICHKITAILAAYLPSHEKRCLLRRKISMSLYIILDIMISLNRTPRTSQNVRSSNATISTQLYSYTYPTYLLLKQGQPAREKNTDRDQHQCSQCSMPICHIDPRILTILTKATHILSLPQ